MSHPNPSQRVSVKDLVDGASPSLHSGWSLRQDPANPTVTILRIADTRAGILLHAKPETSDPTQESWNIRIWTLPTDKANETPDWNDIDHPASDTSTAELAFAILELDEPHEQYVTVFPDNTESRQTLVNDLQNGLAEGRAKYHYGTTTPPSADKLDELARLMIVRKQFLDIIQDAAHRRDFAELYARVPGLHITSAGGVAPYQVEGTWLGYAFYFRFRGGSATLTIARKDDELFSRPLWSAATSHGDDWSGWLNRKEFTSLFCELAGKLGKAWFRFEFQVLSMPEPSLDGFLPAQQSSDIPTREWVWAYTVEEARERLKEYPYNSVQYAHEPITNDDRVYPETTPEFIVLPPQA